jgi:hypothetical protein
MSIQSFDALRCWFLQSRDEYQTCHIRLPDGESVSAIVLNGLYYGFRRRLSLGSQVLKILYKISDSSALTRIQDVVLTTNSKGYFLWIREENALPRGEIIPRYFTTPRKPITFTKLPAGYILCKIRVPDLDQVLSAVEFAGSFYSLFKVEPDPEIVLEVVSKLNQREDEILVAATSEGSAICVLEPEGIRA